jgi:hypothetical protein
MSHTTVAIPDGSIVLMGGMGITGNYLNDVWKSWDEGKTWVPMTMNAPWAPRAELPVLFFLTVALS